jgi:MFS family permease
MSMRFWTGDKRFLLGVRVFRWMSGPKKPGSGYDRDVQIYEDGARLLTETREELNRADAKAQVLLGVASLGIGTVVGGLLAGGWSPLMLRGGLQVMWWLGAGPALVALYLLARAVYPRLTKRPSGIWYFGDVTRYRSKDQIIEELRRRDPHDLAELAEQIRVVSSLVARKYLLIRWGFWLLLISIVTTVGAGALQAVL